MFDFAGDVNWTCQSVKTHISEYKCSFYRTFTFEGEIYLGGGGGRFPGDHKISLWLRFWSSNDSAYLYELDI